jgi:RNase H-like domain found in reverse transcriptase/Reverse transcriptase (RNA-dependent DNA polymerase)
VGLVDNICVASIDDMLIFSHTREAHTTHVRRVLERLRAARLYAKLSKCRFFTQEVDFLGYRVGVAGVSMDPRKMAIIEEWELPDSLMELQRFLGFTNFYRRFIYRYSIIIIPMTDLLKRTEKGKKKKQFVLTDKTTHAFRTLQACFREEVVLKHFDPQKPYRVEADALGFGLGGILSQPYETDTSSGRFVWKPVAFFSRKLSPAERNYGIPDQEMLAIVECYKE